MDAKEEDRLLDIRKHQYILSGVTSAPRPNIGVIPPKPTSVSISSIETDRNRNLHEGRKQTPHPHIAHQALGPSIGPHALNPGLRGRSIDTLSVSSVTAPAEGPLAADAILGAIADSDADAETTCRPACGPATKTSHHRLAREKLEVLVKNTPYH